LPGIWSSLRLDTAVTLPVGVECYAAYALRAWLATGNAISDRTQRFARGSAVFSFALGMAGQVAFHLKDQDQITRAPWAITTLVSCLPVLVLGMGTRRTGPLPSAARRARPPHCPSATAMAWPNTRHLPLVLRSRASTTPAVSPASLPERGSASPGGHCAAEGSNARTRR
jgi:hypothetical protein